MKKISFLLVIVLSFVLFSFDKNKAVFYTKEHFKKELWYPILINKLTKQDRADANSAPYMQSLSSTYVPNEDRSTPKLIERFGKISENEIRMFFKENETDTSVFVFVETTYRVTDLFIFNTQTAQLKRISGRGIVVLIDRLFLHYSDNKGITFYTGSEFTREGMAHRQYFYFDREKNSFEHTKNCDIVNGKENCRDIAPYAWH